MLTENSGEKPLEMENNNTELLKINYSDNFIFKDNEAKENDGCVQPVESGAEAGQEEFSFMSSGQEEFSFMSTDEPPQQESTPVAEVQKRGRGRPPKNKRGRPVKLERVEKEYSMAMESSAMDTDLENNRTAPPIVLKFKLGVKEEKLREDGFILNKSEPIIKRGRGRPRKIKTSPQEKSFIDESFSHDNTLNTSEESPYRPRKPLFLPSTADDLQNDSQLLRPTSNISEMKTRLRGRPKTNYLHVQRMWTPKTEQEVAKKQRRNRKPQHTSMPILKEPVVKGIRGRPRTRPLPDLNKPKIPGRGRPRESYDPEHIKMLLEKKFPKEKDNEKKTPGLRGRPTKIEALKLMLEDRRSSSQLGNDSHTSTKCTTPSQSDDESESLDIDESQLTYPLAKMLVEVQGSKGGESIENKENLLFVSSKSLCDNRKLKEKLLERTDPVFREMKLKFKQELKNIQKLEVKSKPTPSPNPGVRKRGPRGPYKKTLMKNAALDPSIVSPPPREPISQRLIARREAAAAAALAAASKPVEPPPQKKPAIRKKFVPRDKVPQKPILVQQPPRLEPQPRPERQPPRLTPIKITPQKKPVTPTVAERSTNDCAPNYPSDLDRFMKANNLTHRREPVPKILISKNPFLTEPVSKTTLIVTKNPFLDNGQRKNNLMHHQTEARKRGRPRNPNSVVSPPTKTIQNQMNGSEEVFINLVSSDEEEEEDSPMNFTYPTVTNEPVGYDEEMFDIMFPPEHLSENNVSISLISDDDDEDGIKSNGSNSFNTMDTATAYGH